MEDVRGGTNQGQYQGPGAGPSSQGGQPSQLGFGANREALRRAHFPDSYGARRPMIKALNGPDGPVGRAD